MIDLPAIRAELAQGREVCAGDLRRAMETLVAGLDVPSAEWLQQQMDTNLSVVEGLALHTMRDAIAAQIAATRISSLDTVAALADEVELRQRAAECRAQEIANLGGELGESRLEMERLRSELSDERAGRALLARATDRCRELEEQLATAEARGADVNQSEAT